MKRGNHDSNESEETGEFFEVTSMDLNCRGCGTHAFTDVDWHHRLEGTEEWIRCCSWYTDEESPEIVYLCGDTRFEEEHQAEKKRLTLEGKIVLDHSIPVDNIELTDDEKDKLHKLHNEKIALADRVHVINVGGYISRSLKNDIKEAYVNQMPVSYLEPRKTDTLPSETE
jgi:hypothetical protein